MNATQEINAALKKQLEEIGINVEEGEEKELQASNAKEAKEDALNLIHMVRAWLGATVLRDLYISRSRNNKLHKVQISLARYCDELSKIASITTYTKIFVEKMCIRDGKLNEKMVQDAMDALNYFKTKEEGWVMSPWALIRALNAAVRKSNYANYMQKRGWVYTGDSDHKIIVVMMSGQYRWTEPSTFTFSTVDAETEEEYLRPYDIRDIPNPDNTDETIKCRVYRKAGNVVHPSTNNDQVNLHENDSLFRGLRDLVPGQVISKQYDRELRIDEFERQAESDVNYLMERAPEMGIKLWPAIRQETRVVDIYHAGWLDQPEILAATTAGN